MRDRATKSALRSRRKRAKQDKERKKREEKEREKRDMMITSRYGSSAHYACGSKTRYKDKADAMSRALESVTHGAPELRAYLCPYCGGWHLTKRKKHL